MRDDDIKYWFSLENGVHVPVREGESKREAVSKAINNKMSRVERNKDKYAKIDNFKKKKKSNNKISDEENEQDQKRIRELAEKYKNSNSKEEKQKLSDEARKIQSKYRNEDRKIVKMVKRGNKYIPIRKGEDEKKVLKEHDLRNNKNYINKIKEEQYKENLLQNGIRLDLSEKAGKDVAEAKKRRETVIDYDKRASRADMIKYTIGNRKKINNWVKEYNENDDLRNKVERKILNREGLTLKEYYGYLGSKPREGDIILSGGKDGEDVRVGKNGKLEEIKNYRRRKGK